MKTGLPGSEALSACLTFEWNESDGTCRQEYILRQPVWNNGTEGGEYGDMTDYYQVLGIASGASEKEIKAAYRKLAKEYHPDVVGNDPVKKQRMYEIQEAYGVLGDPEKRADYDQKRRDAFQPKEKANVKETSGPVPDRSAFERFFGFQPGKGMETYHDQKKEDPAGAMKPEERFASFFQHIR